MKKFKHQAGCGQFKSVVDLASQFVPSLLVGCFQDVRRVRSKITQGDIKVVGMGRESWNSLLFLWLKCYEFLGCVKHQLYQAIKHFKMFLKEPVFSSSFCLFFFSVLFSFVFLQVSVRAGSPIGCCSRGRTWVNRRKGHFTDGTSLRRQILVNKYSLNISCWFIYGNEAFCHCFLISLISHFLVWCTEEVFPLTSLLFRRVGTTPGFALQQMTQSWLIHTCLSSSSVMVTCPVLSPLANSGNQEQLMRL